MSEMNTMNLSEIGQIAVTVRDLDRSVTFYRDVLGLRFLFDAQPSMAFFDCAGIRLMLGTETQGEVEHKASIIYYRVADIQATYDHLNERGVRFHGKPHKIASMPDHDLWMAFFYDPDNNMLALMSEIPT